MSVTETLDAIEEALDSDGPLDPTALFETLLSAYQRFWDERGEEPSTSSYFDGDLEQFAELAARLSEMGA